MTKLKKIGDRNLMMSVSEYVSNKLIKRHTTYRIKPDGTSCYIVDGQEISEQEMNRRYPTPATLLKKHNCNTTKDYLY